jgi:hypothetical protein
MITEIKVNVKYKTKNNIKDDNPVFLAIINQITANTSSIRNLRPMATRVCMVWLPGSLDCPLKKIITVVRAIIVKAAERIAMSLK